MPRVAYSEEERKRVKEELLAEGLKLMARQGVQHTTVEQIYKKVGISRTFFYSFFSGKEELAVESLYLQQPRILSYARRLTEDPSLSRRGAVEKFLFDCCYGEKNGIAVLSVEDQQLLFRRLPEEELRKFRRKQAQLFGEILECFGIRADRETTALFINLCLAVMVIRKAIPETLPLLVPEAADETAAFQIRAIADYLEKLRQQQ